MGSQRLNAFQMPRRPPLYSTPQYEATRSDAAPASSSHAEQCHPAPSHLATWSRQHHYRQLRLLHDRSQVIPKSLNGNDHQNTHTHRQAAATHTFIFGCDLFWHPTCGQLHLQLQRPLQLQLHRACRIAFPTIKQNTAHSASRKRVSKREKKIEKQKIKQNKMSLIISTALEISLALSLSFDIFACTATSPPDSDQEVIAQET